MLRLSILFVTLMLTVDAAHAQNDARPEAPEVAFDARLMDSNGDGNITKEEFLRFHATYWTRLSKGNATVSVDDAAAAFARANMNLDAYAMDIGHNGVISRAEFMRYAVVQFDRAKNNQGVVTVDNARVRFSSRQPRNIGG